MGNPNVLALTITNLLLGAAVLGGLVWLLQAIAGDLRDRRLSIRKSR
jgi:hypothetical protein